MTSSNRDCLDLKRAALRLITSHNQEIQRTAERPSSCSNPARNSCGGRASSSRTRSASPMRQNPGTVEAARQVERAQCGPTRSPKPASPRHARNHSLLADPAERISSNTPAPPHSVRNRASGRAPQPSFHQHPYRFCYYRSIGGIFLKEGFQATIKLPAPPPRVTAR
jgi:hypothetical protein